MGAPQIAGTVTGSIDIGNPPVTGQLTDAGNGFGNTWSISNGATYGSATINASGLWSFTLNPSHPAVAALGKNDTLSDIFTVRLDDLAGTDFQDITITINGVPCFVRGTHIDTPDGPRAIEDLRVGDMVLTLDAGPQPIRWIGRRRAAGRGADAPVRFETGAAGNRRVLMVSPQHRMLVRGHLCELYMGVPEALVPALHLVDGKQVTQVPCDAVEYFHFVLDSHQIVFAEGAASESFFLGGDMANAIPELVAWAERLRRANPAAWARARNSVRPHLRRHEGSLLTRDTRSMELIDD